MYSFKACFKTFSLSFVDWGVLSFVDGSGVLQQWQSLKLRTIHQLVSGACATNLHRSSERSSRNLDRPSAPANWQFPTAGTSSPLPEHASLPAAPESGGSGRYQVLRLPVRHRVFKYHPATLLWSVVRRLSERQHVLPISLKVTVKN